MSQHFVETAGAQPQLFVFKQEFVDEIEPNFDDLLCKWEVDFDALQQQAWAKYWAAHGQELILEQWKLKYKNYLAESERDGVLEELAVGKVHEEKLTDYAREQEIEPNGLNIDENHSHAEGWLELWRQHSEEVYFEQYILYTSIYYNYHLDVKRSLQSKIATFGEIATFGSHEDNTDALADDLEQLKLLGLPTAFGGRPQGNWKKRSKTPTHRLTEYSLYFSDEEDDMNMDTIETLETNSPTENEPEPDAALHEIQQHAISKKKKKKNRKLRNVPAFLLEEKGMLKYWHKRFSLFSRYDEGIRLDRESWFSVTPEKIATHLAMRLACDVLIDGFCGCGGNAIQFAKSCRRVIAVDIDPAKVEMAKHNAGIYGVVDKIDFIVGDFLQLCDGGQLRGDAVFLSPPWGGPKYKKNESYDIEHFLEPCSATELMEKARRVSENVALFLPRNSNLSQVIKLAGVGNRCEVEHNYLDTRLVAITALYGEKILKQTVEKDVAETA